jgi:hypothetical protein
MKNTLLLFAVMSSLFASCAKKVDSSEESTSKLQGAWTLATQTQQGQVSVPVSKPKPIDQFGSTTKNTMQLEITNLSLRLVETDFVQVTATNYAFIVSNNNLILVNNTDPSAPQETIGFEFKNNNSTLILNTINFGVLTFTKITPDSLATKTALSLYKEQMVDILYLVSLGGSSTTPVEISTKGKMKGVQATTDKVRIKCTYDNKAKKATILYSNTEESLETKINLVVDLEFDLTTKNENSLFSSSGSMTSEIYGKKITGTDIQCAGSLSRVELYTKLDLRCKGLNVDGSTSNPVEFAGKIQCLF